MTNREKLQTLIQDVFLLDSAEFSFDLHRSAVDTWDSFGIVSLAVGVEEVFGYHCTPDEANAISGVQDLVFLLSQRGVSFDD